MQRPPLPVDVVTSTWDYIVGTADILAGLGAAGALLIAARAYSRQVDESSRKQATLIDVVTRQSDESPGIKDCLVVNKSDQSIKLVMVSIPDQPDVMNSVNSLLPRAVFPRGDYWLFNCDSASDAEAFVLIQFNDASGRSWLRYNDGVLQHNTRLQVMLGKLTSKHSAFKKVGDAYMTYLIRRGRF